MTIPRIAAPQATPAPARDVPLRLASRARAAASPAAAPHPPQLLILYWNHAAAPAIVPVASRGDDDAEAERATIAALLEAVARQIASGDAPPRAAEARGGDATLVERFGDVEVAPGARRVTRAGIPVPLTATEFDLLLALLRRRGDVATRAELRRENPRLTGESGRALDTHICGLRRKLEPGCARRSRHILTVHGVGYRLER